MPLIEAKIQRGALSDDQLDDLAGRLTEVASDAEESDLEKAKKDHLVSGMTDAVREVVGEDDFVPMAC